MLVAAGAVVAVATGVAAALFAEPADNGAPSPLAAVTSALGRTSAGSYSFTLDSKVRVKGREIQSDMVSGVLDLGRQLGTELLTTTARHHLVTARVLFIGRYVYTWASAGSGFATMGKPWSKAPVPPTAAGEMPDGPYSFVSDEPVSPAGLAWVLGSAGTVRYEGPASGLGWTGTKYAFTASLSGGRESVTGTVYVDQRGRARRLVTITTQEGIMTTERDLTFGDLGAPVQVTAPPASQVKYTTSRAYWGFYF
jgi:hypothetical protein